MKIPLLRRIKAMIFFCFVLFSFLIY